MTNMPILETVLETAKGMHEVGVISDARMREYEILCNPPPRAYTPAQIRRIRKRTTLSEGVFAACLNTSKATIRRWERGQTKPNGPARKLLHLIERKGLEAICLQSR